MILRSIIFMVLATSFNPAQLVGQTYRVQFRGANWEQALDWLGDTADLEIIAPKYPDGDLNLRTPSKKMYSRAEAIELFSVLLHDEGFGVILRGSRFHVVDLDNQAARQKVFRLARKVTVKQLADLPTHSIVQCEIDMTGIQVRSPNVTQKQLRALLNPAAYFMWENGMQTALVCDTVAKILEFNDRLERIGEPILRVRLMNRPAQEVMREIEPLIQQGAGRRGDAQGGGPKSGRLKATIADDGESVVFSGSAAEVERYARLARELDSEDPAVRSIKSFSLVGLDGRTIIEQLTPLVRDTNSGGSQQRRGNNGKQGRSLGNGPVLVVDSTQRWLWAAGNQWQLARVRDAITEMQGLAQAPIARHLRLIPDDSELVRQAVTQCNSVWRNANVAVSTHVIDAISSRRSSSLLEPTDDSIRIVYLNGQTTITSRSPGILDQYSSLLESVLGNLDPVETAAIPCSFRLPTELITKVSPILRPTLRRSSKPTVPAKKTTPTAGSFPLTPEESKGGSLPLSGEPEDNVPRSKRVASRSIGPSETIQVISLAGSPELTMHPLDEQGLIRATGSAAQLRELKQLISLLDVPEDEATLPSRIQPLYRSGESVITHLRQVFGPKLHVVAEDSQDARFPRPAVSRDPASDAIFVYAGSRDRKNISNAIASFDRKVEQTGKTICFVTTSSPMIAKTIANLFSDKDEFEEEMDADSEYEAEEEAEEDNKDKEEAEAEDKDRKKEVMDGNGEEAKENNQRRPVSNRFSNRGSRR
ncbi:MAG: hypothetical protein AAF483_17560 [Planctomycetota bacterium]